MSTAQIEDDDVVFVEPRPVGIVVNVAAQISLADRRDRFGERRIFQGRAVYMSAIAFAFVSSVKVKIGDRVIASIDDLGRLDGIVSRVLDGGFLMNLLARRGERDKLAEKVQWLGKQRNYDVVDRRAGPRTTPANMFVSVVMPNGSSETCLVLNISTAGAALLAETTPEIGTILVTGKMVGQVVRHFDGGFAVQFIGSTLRNKEEAKADWPQKQPE